MTTLKLRGSETRADDTATPPRYDLPACRVHYHVDDRGPFWVAVCGCGAPASPEFDGPDGGATAEYWRALHEQAHQDEIEAAS